MKTSLIRYNRPRILMISAAITFLSLMGLCNAAQPDFRESLRMNVSYADLNIDSPAGVKVLYSRLRSAARRVCAPFDDGQQRTINFHFRACVKNALDSAVAQVNKPTLSAMHARVWPAAGG
jgi:UrcA family protein